jgi:putative aldouronate transport system permease protein
MITSPDFYLILKNSIVFSLYRLIWGFPFPIFIAVLLNEVKNIYFKKVSQTVLYLPYFISWVVLAGIIANFLSPNGGIINYVLKFFNVAPIAFLQKPEYFRTIIISAEIWKTAGWGTIIYLAAMTGINQEMYESAYIDGATRIQRIFYITIPSIIPTIIVLLVLNTGNILRNGFEQIFLLYNPMVYDVADVFETYTYRMGIQGGRFSFASSVGVFQSLVGFVLITITNFISKKYGEGGIY